MKLSIFHFNLNDSLHDFVATITLFSFKNIDSHQLFDEFISLKTFAENMEKKNLQKKNGKNFEIVDHCLLPFVALSFQFLILMPPVNEFLI